MLPQQIADLANKTLVIKASVLPKHAGDQIRLRVVSRASPSDPIRLEKQEYDALGSEIWVDITHNIGAALVALRMLEAAFRSEWTCSDYVMTVVDLGDLGPVMSSLSPGL